MGPACAGPWSGTRLTTSWFGVFAEADMTNLARLNREQAEHESALHATTTIARVPFTVWEKAHHENWDKSDWDKFLNDPVEPRLPRLGRADLEGLDGLSAGRRHRLELVDGGQSALKHLVRDHG
jgi:hypothetical protein